MEREAKLGLGLALVVGLLISLVLYLAPGVLPSAFGGRPTSEEVVQAFQAEGLEVGNY
jgi:Na+-driven multidrug efflux pump